MTENLPPLRLPELASIAPAPVVLRPLEMADNATAFVLSEIAFGMPVEPDHAARQGRWEQSARAWFGWLQTQAAGNAWAATVAATGQVVGYARAVRDSVQRVEQLTEIFVHPAFQHGQVGRSLLAAVLAPDVPSGWQRIICAHPDPAALALYHRWGTYPLATAWYVAPTFTPAESEHLATTVAAQRSNGFRLRQLVWEQDAAVISHLDRTLTGMDRSAHIDFMARLPGAAGVVCERDGVFSGFGMRLGGSIGPVVGQTPADTLALVQTHLLAMHNAGHPIDGLWVPGANEAILRWLRSCGARCLIRGQVQIMASNASFVVPLDRLTLTAPAYVW